MAPTWEGRLRQAVAGVIESAAMVRANNQELWAELRPRLAESGLTLGREGFALIREMRSAAVARRKGYEAFQKAGPEAVFSLRHAAPDFNIRNPAVRAIQPEYLARFDATYRDITGEIRTRTVSVRDNWTPGMTIGDVYDAVQEAAEGMANESGGTLYGELISVTNVRPVLI